MLLCAHEKHQTLVVDFFIRTATLARVSLDDACTSGTFSRRRRYDRPTSEHTKHGYRHRWTETLLLTNTATITTIIYNNNINKKKKTK